MSKSLSIIVSVLLAVIVVAAMGEVSLRSQTCMVCHKQEASYANWMKNRLLAEKKGFSHELVACADCHIEGSPNNTVASRFRGILHTLTYVVPQFDPRKPQITGLFNKTTVPSENCKTCHFAATYRNTVFKKDMPTEDLKLIGMQMDHRKHVFARENTCSKCHERYKDQEGSKIDKEVNYSEVNHMACDSCHSLASHAFRSGQIFPVTIDQFTNIQDDAWDRLSTNPRWMVSFPSEKTCRRCHNGQIHYKTRIFKSECRESYNLENCLKCHPTMTQEWLDGYKKKRESRTYAAQGANHKFVEGINSVFDSERGKSCGEF